MHVTCFGSLEWPGLLETVTVAQSIKSSVKHPSCFYLKLKQDFVHCIVEIGVLTTLLENGTLGPVSRIQKNFHENRL